MKFVLATHHTPARYKQLFQELSSRYLMPESPSGIATIKGYETRCITNLTAIRFIIGIKQPRYFFDVDRATLKITMHYLGCSPSPENSGKFLVEFWHSESEPLAHVLNTMIKDGIPYPFSDDFVTELGI